MAQKLIGAFGDRRVEVPRGRKPDGTEFRRLSETLGPAIAEELCQDFGGSYLEVPRGVDADRSSVGRRVAELHRAGKKVAEIAPEVGCRRRTVFPWLSRRVAEVL